MVVNNFRHSPNKQVKKTIDQDVRKIIDSVLRMTRLNAGIIAQGSPPFHGGS